ncbi:repeat and LEM domain-containing 1 [Octopus vulgaris]|uniref:Repeat and LEM domain-containing 1 n=1 Tax=Octopus vulgaris TaxID=6645 RepID=A0AA36FH26_OCTVU|nr:repeat and LEM domain-containing 1 [Octopus vulgaris]
MAHVHGDQKLKDAIEKQNERKVRQLLEDGIDPNALFHDDDIAPIHLGPGINKSITHLLLEYGGNPNLRTQEGVTPLHIAATWGNTDTLKLLLKNGGDITLRDADGNTALDMAQNYAHEDCIRILQRHSQKLKSKLDAHLRQLKRSCSLNEKTKPTSSRYVHRMPSESFNASQYVTADSDPEEYESLEKSKSKPSFSILKRTQNGLVHHSKDKQFEMRKSVSTESYEEKYSSKNTGHQSSDRPIPALRRRTGNIANLPEKFKDTEVKSKKESEVSSEMFLTPTASSPRRHRHRPSRRYHSDDDSPNVSSLDQISSSEEELISSTNTTTDSDLYITVNETPQKPVFPRIDSDLSIDLQRKMEKLQSLKIPIAQKIEQLRNCLNKLENNQLSASLEQILHESLINESKPISVPIVRESYPPTHSRLWNGRHREGRTQPAHSVHKKSSPNNVDIKLSMDIPSGKIYVNERNIKKSKHRGHQTYEIHLDSSESTEKSSNRSKDDSVIDIKLKPKKKSHKKIYVVNPPHGSEFPAKYERFEYLNPENNDKGKLVCNEPSYRGPYPNVTENNHNRNNPRFYNPAAGHTGYLPQRTNQNGWGRGQYIDERCDRIVANTTSSLYQKIPRSNAEKTSSNKEKQQQEPSRTRENGHPSGHLYPKLTALTDNDDESCENRTSVRCVQIPPRLQQQQQNVHLRTVSGRDHFDGAVEETIVKQVFRPPRSKPQAVLSKRSQEFRKPDSQVLTHAEVLQEEEPSRNKISAGNKNFRFGGRVTQKPCHRDIAAKTTVPMVMNTPLNPQIARCKLYETESAVQNMDVKRTESNVSCATTDTYVTCRTTGSENSEEFFSCDDGTNESALESKFESALHSFSSYLKNQFEQSNSQEFSSFQDFRFNTEELSKAMLELNLKEGNDSSIDAEAYMSMLSRIEDQIITEPQQNGQESISLYTSQFKDVNTPENSCYISTSEQCQPVNSQQVVHRQSVSPELKCYDPKESKYNSALLPRESDEDSLYLVCFPNNSSAAQFQSFDEPDCKRLVPKPPKLLPESQQKKYSADRDRDSNEPEKIRGSHSSQFSQVMSELQGKFQRKAAQPTASFYRWQPPDYVLKSKVSSPASKAVGSTIISNTHQENLKRNVGIELKNHPLVKKFNRSDDGELSSSCVENSYHFHSCETSGNANCSNMVSEPIVSKSNDVPLRIERTASRSHFVSFEEKKKLHCKPSRKQGRLVDLHSYYTSVQEEDGLDHSRYVSVQEEEEQQLQQVDSRYVSVQGEAKPADSQYLSFQEDEIPNSCYLSVHGENQPFTSQSHYLSVREEPEASSSKHHSILAQNQNKSANSQSHFLSAQEDGLGISKINHIQQRRKRIPQNEPVTLKTRFTSPTDNCGDQSHYESFQDGMVSIEGQYFSTVQQDSSNSLKDQNLEQSSALDKSAVNSQWQYVSASSGFHNRSVTWQNPISTYDEPDAVVVPSTDDSLSWSPGKDGHPPQIPPFTSTSASEDVTSGSTSSDGLKKCLASKEFLSPEKRTTMWVNGLYKIEEYFDQNISSINPVTSQSSSSDNVINMKKIAANANRPQPSAPPKSEVFSEFTTAHSDFNAITDISTVAVAGTTGDKSDPLTPSSRSPQRPTLYPSLHDPLPNPASSPTREDYPVTLRQAMRELPNWTETIEMEQKMVEKFEGSKYSQKRKGGNLKHFFTYLLLDPRVTKNLPFQASKIGDKSELFRNFVYAIFYVGKGTRDRPYSHLYEAMKRLNSKETKNDEKLSHIIDIWNDEQGVISLHCFQGVISDEAHSREACIIDAIGLFNLTNKMRGTCYGLTAKWSASQKRRMGTYWLYKAFQIFLAEGERQIFPIDLDCKS